MTFPNRCPIEVIGYQAINPNTGHRYINLDNAATTPVAVPVMQAVAAFMDFYGSVHRGSGWKSVLSTEVYERALRFIRSFVGADDNAPILLSSNTTSAINRLAYTYPFSPGDIVLLSQMEHSSNELPWRRHATTVHFRSTDDGSLDLDDLEVNLRRFGRRVRLVAVTGASNVTGHLSPLAEVVALAHSYGVEVFVDCAQLIAHRAIQMQYSNSLTNIDYIAFSGHKMYAPFGIGVLVARRGAFDHLPPDLPGGGTVEMVTDDAEIWAEPQARFTPGTPNVPGVVAMCAAMQMIAEIGFDRIRSYEKDLVAAGRRTLQSIPGITLRAQGIASSTTDGLPIFPFTVEGYDSALVAAVLGNEYGIGVRQGHLCQYGFMRHALGVTVAQQEQVEADLRGGDKRSMYGMVRASCGLSTVLEDLCLLGDALKRLIERGPSLDYRRDRSTGQYVPVNAPVLGRGYLPDALRFLEDHHSPSGAIRTP